jgi:hypothetical protein
MKLLNIIYNAFNGSRILIYVCDIMVLILLPGRL